MPSSLAPVCKGDSSMSMNFKKLSCVNKERNKHMLFPEGFLTPSLVLTITTPLVVLVSAITAELLRGTSACHQGSPSICLFSCVRGHVSS